MATITHTFINPKADSSDTTITRPSDWNAPHSLDGIVVSDINRQITVSTLDPSGGVNGDIWLKYTP
jgi:hypothetical protein